MAGITLLFSEVLDKVHKAKTKDQKVKILRQHNTPALRSVLKASFDPRYGPQMLTDCKSLPSRLSVQRLKLPSYQ